MGCSRSTLASSARLPAWASATMGSTVTVELIRANRLRCRHRFGHLVRRILLVEEDLPLQIAQLNQIAIDQAHEPHTGANQQLGQRRAQRAAADQQHARLAEATLALGADLRQNALAIISVGLIHRGQCRIHTFYAGTRLDYSDWRTRSDMPVDTPRFWSRPRNWARCSRNIRPSSASNRPRKPSAKMPRRRACWGNSTGSWRHWPPGAAGPAHHRCPAPAAGSLQSKIVSHIKIKNLNLAQWNCRSAAQDQPDIPAAAGDAPAPPAPPSRSRRVNPRSPRGVNSCGSAPRNWP